MTLLLLYVLTFVIFLAIDYIGLSYLIKPIFTQDIGPLLRDSPSLGPALLFYAFYIAGLLWFVSWPAMAADRSLLWVFGSAALIGAMAYGTYEFTNLATLKGWTWRMVMVDLSWGSMLTGVSATLGLALSRAISTDL